MGKQLAKAILKDLTAEGLLLVVIGGIMVVLFSPFFLTVSLFSFSLSGEVNSHDCSTNGLINRLKSKK